MEQPKRFGYAERVIKVKDMLKRLAGDGWVPVAQRGRHRQFQHPGKPGKVTVAGHPSETLDCGTYKSIVRRAGLKD